MRRSTSVVVTMVLMLGTLALSVAAADLKPIHTQKGKDVVIKLMSETGQWTQGKNAFVLEFASAKDGKAVDAGKAGLSTSMAMPGMAPMITGATLAPDGPGRYRGTIDFPDRGARQVTVSWDGPAGKGSAKFSVSVR